ncbi:DUF5343 domain-containing protein [Knoellia locipacati]|uniref:hypothetical protein n=1 Tax=Knoellia locipacati TaxID=882824 RepID=UPI00384DABB7
MAEGNEASERKTFPQLSPGVWWALRDRFKRSIPGSVDANYIHTVLGVSEKSAANYLGQLKMIGLVDGQGKATELAAAWRLDDKYAEACQTILDICYPQGLLDAVPDPATDRASAQRWFMSKGVGEATARFQAQFLALVADADPSGGDSRGVKANGDKKTPRKTAAKKTAARAPAAAETNADNQTQSPMADKRTGADDSARDNRSKNRPDLHIDVQVHIAADASVEQIDAVFASMARHIYDR